MKKILSIILIVFTLGFSVSAEPSVVDEKAQVSSRFENAQGEKINSAKVGDTVYFAVNLSGIDKTNCGHIGVIKLDFSYPQDALAPTLSKDDKRYVDESTYDCPTVPENYKDTVYATAPERNKLVFYYNFNITKIKQSAITKNGTVFRVALKVVKAGNFIIDFMKDTCSAAGWNKKENRVAGFSLSYSSAPTLKSEKSASQTTQPTTTGKKDTTHNFKTRIISLKRKGKNKVAVRWVGCKCHRKYIVKYAYNKKMKKAKYKTVTSRNTVLRKLKSGKRLYVRVKAKGKTYSKRKSIKIY